MLLHEKDPVDNAVGEETKGAAVHSAEGKGKRTGERRREVRTVPRRAVAAPPPSVPPLPSGTAALEKTFLSLAAAFGETIVPLGRGANLKQREVEWRGRIAHFESLMRQQQVL